MAFLDQIGACIRGYDMPHVPVTRPGRALLNDPLLYLGLGEILTRAEEFIGGEPARAAELFGQLAQRLDQGFPTHAEAFRVREREMLIAAEDPAAAFAVTMRLLMDRLRLRRPNAGRTTQGNRVGRDSRFTRD